MIYIIFVHDSIGVGGWGGGQKVGRPVPGVVANRVGSILGKGFFSESSAKMRLFENLGIWVDFFNGANKMHPSRRYPL